jgi:hypothetical protein
MAHADHYGVVVGISHYPSLGDPPDTTAHLKGPENDADAVCAWLKSAAGVPDANIKVVKSSTFMPPDPTGAAKPTITEIDQCLLWLDELARKNKDSRKGLRVGRRLYLYVSGHGFSPKRNQGCLFAANASPRYGATSNISHWIEWLQDANYFDEFVLWMDCCMNRMSSLPPSPVLLPAATTNEPAGPAFIAFAAQRPLKAVEAPVADDENRVHGVFTWALLDGLRGAAVDQYGMITSYSLANWLRNAMRPRMSSVDLNDPDVAKEPDILKQDPGLVFARGLAPKAYKTVLSFPAAAAGQQARLWGGRPPQIHRGFTIESTVELALAPGLYLLDSPGAGLRQGLEVAGVSRVDISEKGAPVSAGSDDVFLLDVTTPGPATEIYVLDERFGLVDRDLASLRLRLPRGIYKVKTRLARSIREKVLLLDRDNPDLESVTSVPLMTAAPLQSTKSSHEYQQAAAMGSPQAVDVMRGEGAAITVMARVWTEDGHRATGMRPWSGVRVVDEKGAVLADLEHDGRRDEQADPFAVCSLAVRPGTYFLRQILQNGQEMEQSLVVPESWSLQVFVLRLVEPGGQTLSPYARVSLMMHRLGTPFSAADSTRKTMEVARVALADERAILKDDVEVMLLRKFEDPLAGIIGGHLLLIERERDPKRDIGLLDAVVRNLRSMLQAEHPDVECLSLQCQDKSLRCKKAPRSIPIYQRSWKLLIEASRENPSLVPKKTWNRVQAHSALPPYLIWAPDQESKAASREAIANALINAAARAPATIPPADVPAVEAAMQPAHMPGSPIFKGLPRKILAKHAAQLQVPPAAIKSLDKDILSKIRDR